MSTTTDEKNDGTSWTEIRKSWMEIGLHEDSVNTCPSGIMKNLSQQMQTDALNYLKFTFESRVIAFISVSKNIKFGEARKVYEDGEEEG